MEAAAMRSMLVFTVLVVAAAAVVVAAGCGPEPSSSGKDKEVQMPANSANKDATKHEMPALNAAGSFARLPSVNPSRTATMMPLMAPCPKPSAAAR